MEVATAYQTLLGIGSAVFIAAVIKSWDFSKGALILKPDGWLVILCLILGASWLASGAIEGFYLKELVEFLPSQFHITWLGYFGFLLIWCALFALAIAPGNVFPFCVVYLVYVLWASFIIQPAVGRYIGAAVNEAAVQHAVSNERAAALLSYYDGPQWFAVSTESCLLAFLATFYAWMRRYTDKQLSFRNSWWFSPHFVLTIEFAVSQSIIWYHRSILYFNS